MSEPLSQAEVSELRHELRTPFNAIIGYAEMLLEVAADDGLEELVPGLESLRASGKELLGAVNAALSAGAEVRRDELAELGGRVAADLRPLSLTLTELIQMAHAGPAREALPDLERIRGATWGLAELAQERLLYDSGVAAPADRDRAAPSETPALEAPDRFALDAGVVLVVDDNSLNRDLLCRRLERQGYQPVSCPGGREALAQLEQGGIDVVLLDILMPEIDGYEVLQQIKSSEKLRDLPVIMISALDEMSSVVRCIEMGAEDYLPKPFDPVLLRARVGACLEKKRLRDKELEYLRGVEEVQKAAMSVEAGSFEPGSLEAVAARADELGRLARVFQHMASEVRAREERLKSEVRKLQIQIDERDTQKRVAEILESDFAQSLVEKARQLRRRAKKDDAAE